MKKLVDNLYKGIINKKTHNSKIQKNKEKSALKWYLERNFDRPEYFFHKPIEQELKLLEGPGNGYKKKKDDSKLYIYTIKGDLDDLDKFSIVESAREYQRIEDYANYFYKTLRISNTLFIALLSLLFII